MSWLGSVADSRSRLHPIRSLFQVAKDVLDLAEGGAKIIGDFLGEYVRIGKAVLAS